MEVSGAQKKKSRLTLYIVICLFAGIILGFALNKSYLSEENKALTEIDLSILQTDGELHVADSNAYKQLTLKKEALKKSRNEILSAREKKVEPFTLIADIFLRL